MKDRSNGGVAHLEEERALASIRNTVPGGGSGVRFDESGPAAFKMMETYFGYVRTPADAIKLFEACRLGILPRVQRRLSEKERKSIRSGSVFVWDEREAGMRRWTDGKSWSASRVSGSFLTYREMEGKRGTGFGGLRRGAGKTPDSSGLGSDEDQDDGEPDGYRYKPDGLMKQSFSITTSTGQHLHLISYYSRPHPGQPELPQPSIDPQLRNIVPLKGMYPESSMHDAPITTMSRPAIHHHVYVASQQQHGMPANGQQQYSPYWPPSPISTPPYSHHYTVSSAYPPQSQLPPPPGHYPIQQPYMGSPSYDRSPLPHPGAVAQARTPPGLGQYNQIPNHHLSTSPHMSHAPNIESPRCHPAHPPPPMIDPKLTAMSARNPQGPLPSISTTGPTSTPPQRALSISPPRSSPSDANHPGSAAGNSNKASLSALLHPTPASSEPSSANPGNNSAGSSPRQMAGLTGNGTSLIHHPSQQSEDARALSVLDRKFRI